MQPTSERSHLPPSPYPPGEPYPPATYPPPAAATPTVVKTARPWRVAVVAFVTFLVLIAALGNQWVIDAIFRHRVSNSFLDNAARALGTYQWRFRPPGGHDHARVWLGSLTLVATVLVLTLLLVAVVARGRGSFGQAFVATWMTVLFATVLATYARAAVLDDKSLNIAADGKPTFIMFSQISPNSYQVAAGLGFGLVVGVFAGLTATISRRTQVIGAPPPAPMAAGMPEPHAPQPGQQVAATPEPWPSAPPAPSPWVKQPNPSAADQAADRDDQIENPAQRTAVLPVIDDATRGEQTTQLPRMGYGPDEVADDPADRTTQLPRVEYAADEVADDPADRTTQLPRVEVEDQQGPHPQGQDSPGQEAKSHDPQGQEAKGLDPQGQEAKGQDPQQDEPRR